MSMVDLRANNWFDDLKTQKKATFQTALLLKEQKTNKHNTNASSPSLNDETLMNLMCSRKKKPVSYS